MTISTGPFKLNSDSIKKICGNSKQAMIYGWRHCKYAELGRALRESKNSPLKKVFDATLGNPETTPKVITTLEGRKIKQFQYDIPRAVDKRSRSVITQRNTQISKAGITNLVFENYLRKLEGKELIPLIFCVDIENNPHPTDSFTISTREQKLNNLITHTELRRCYKLCHELGGDLEDIAEVARQTIKFVKLAKNKQDEYYLEEIVPFWDQKDWDDKWAERKLQKAKGQDISLNKIPKMKDQIIKEKNLHASSHLKGTG